MTFVNEEEAARESLDARVKDWRTGRELRMGTWIEGRLRELEPTAQAHGLGEYFKAVEERLDQGCPSRRWLEQVRRGKKIRHVICEAAEEIAETDKALMGAECS